MEILLRILKESDAIVSEGAPKHPHIHEDDQQFYLVVEGCMITSSDNLNEALLLWAISFCLFSIREHQGACETQHGSCEKK